MLSEKKITEQKVDLQKLRLAMKLYTSKIAKKRLVAVRAHKLNLEILYEERCVCKGKGLYIATLE